MQSHERQLSPFPSPFAGAHGTNLKNGAKILNKKHNTSIVFFVFFNTVSSFRQLFTQTFHLDNHFFADVFSTRFLPRALTLRISLFFFLLKYLVTLYLRCKQGCSTSHASMFGARCSIFYLFYPGWDPWKPIPLRYVLNKRDVRVCFCFNRIASFKKDACWHHRNKRSQSWNIFHVNDYNELCFHTSHFYLFQFYLIC